MNLPSLNENDEFRAPDQHCIAMDSRVDGRPKKDAGIQKKTGAEICGEAAVCTRAGKVGRRHS